MMKNILPGRQVGRRRFKRLLLYCNIVAETKLPRSGKASKEKPLQASAERPQTTTHMDNQN
ncbi:hypothetical protein FRX31_024556 [Thalictrum thalictroides]|uniref:Uncharacterized protein n=1 Tax=Thalictrum thalictroides TaxID=46969 RepID=A0A7J6VMK9_THATH|nr:hypothetical protein FRX31_024556 [Thalictrum thalictroides]